MTRAVLIAFDPEGILSTLPAIVNVIAGWLAGIFIRGKGKNDGSVARLLMAGVLLVFAALFWAQFFPLAKKLWTSPFVLLTVGIDLVILGLLIFYVEVRQGAERASIFSCIRCEFAGHIFVVRTTVDIPGVRYGLHRD